MRSLTDTPAAGGVAEYAFERGAKGRTSYDQMLRQMRDELHAGCVFNRESSALPDVSMYFDDSGALHGEFTATELQQGYADRMHGGVVAAVFDASMAMCLMGHGICGYTVSMTVKYRRPVALYQPTKIITRITGTAIGGSVYDMKCDLYQGRNRVAGATGQFYREKQA